MKRAISVLLTLLLAVPAAAEVTTDGASILFFPRVSAGPDGDTRIEISNGSLMRADLRCTYLNASGAEAVTFSLHLDRRAPTQWRVSRGRSEGEAAPCSRQQPELDCEDAGAFHGSVPAVPTPFTGALVCLQVDRSGAPRSGNALRGRATLASADGDIAAYEALGLIGYATNDGDERLCLAGGGDVFCHTAEYAGCPASWSLPHLAAGAADLAAPAGTTVQTSITVLPCNAALAATLAPLSVGMTASDGTQFVDSEVALEAAVPYDLRVAQSNAPGGALTTSIGAGLESFAMVAETRRERDGEPPTGRTAVVPRAYPGGSMVILPALSVDAQSGVDTVIQLANDSSDPVAVRCAYEDTTPVCVGGTGRCIPDPALCSGTCETAYSSTEVDLTLTKDRTLAWRASAGLTGTLEIPPLPDPFAGLLRCAATDAAGRPIAADVLRASATIETVTARTDAAPAIDAAQYGAEELRAAGAGPDGDPFLVAGGPAAEYAGCATNLILPHLADGAAVASGAETAATATVLVLAPCGGDLAADQPARSIVQFLVHNEYGQRFSTSKPFVGQLAEQMSLIDTTDSTRSIFSAGVGGTLGAQTVIKAVGEHGDTGVAGVVIERHRAADGTVHSAAVSVHRSGTSDNPDVLAIAAICGGDCDRSGAVAVDDLVRGVNIALGSAASEECPSMDGDDSGDVTINELLVAVRHLLDGCPVAIAPTPVPTSTRPPSTPRSQVGPEITYLGIATADDVAIAPTGTDDEGRPLVYPQNGQGITLVIEARRGTNQRPIGTKTFDQAGELPDLQLIVSRPLGDGSAAVCDVDPPTSGGVPATTPFSFDAAAATAVNDLGCRAEPPMPLPTCTRQPNGEYAYMSRDSEIQFCIPLAATWAFTPFDTTVAARVRDVSGNLSTPRELVVRVDQVIVAPGVGE